MVWLILADSELRTTPEVGGIPFFSLDIIFKFKSQHHHHQNNKKRNKEILTSDTMPPLSIFESSRQRACNDVSSSNSTFSALANTKRPISPPAASGRTVKFSPEAKVYRTMNRDDYTAEEKNACWLNQNDFAAMKVDRKITIKLMERGDSLVDDGQHYYRGLESKTREGSRRKQFNAIDASMAVFEEQMQQETDGSADAESIAKIYMSCSRHCIEAAHQRGLIDERNALESVSVSAPTTQQLQTNRPSCRAA